MPNPMLESITKKGSARTPRMCVYINATHPGLNVPGLGYRAVIAQENEDGFRPTGEWPVDGRDHSLDAPGVKRPWFWGPTLEEAEARAVEYNRNLGLSEKDADIIVGRSMAVSLRKDKRRRA